MLLIDVVAVKDVVNDLGFTIAKDTDMSAFLIWYVCGYERGKGREESQGKGWGPFHASTNPRDPTAAHVTAMSTPSDPMLASCSVSVCSVFLVSPPRNKYTSNQQAALLCALVAFLGDVCRTFESVGLSCSQGHVPPEAHPRVTTLSSELLPLAC